MLEKLIELLELGFCFRNPCLQLAPSEVIQQIFKLHPENWSRQYEISWHYFPFYDIVSHSITKGTLFHCDFLFLEWTSSSSSYIVSLGASLPLPLPLLKVILVFKWIIVLVFRWSDQNLLINNSISDLSFLLNNKRKYLANWRQGFRKQNPSSSNSISFSNTFKKANYTILFSLLFNRILITITIWSS